LEVHEKRIDVHHHLIPPVYKRELERFGIKDSGGRELPEWTPERSLELMDRHETQFAILSVSCPGVYFGDTNKAIGLARDCNEYSRETSEKHPDRFGFFAVLPMPIVHAAIEEAIYALDILEAQGVILLASTDGKYLGDPVFDDLMFALNQRHAVVLLHPNTPSESINNGLSAPPFLIEFLCDTTRAALNLILMGVMERYPNIRWILSHSGGFLPYVAWRASIANGMPEFITNIPKGVIHYIRQFYYDTALSPSPYSLASLRELVDPSHILFGSDYPFAPSGLVSVECKMLDESKVFDDQIRTQIMHKNALSLFPELERKAPWNVPFEGAETTLWSRLRRVKDQVSRKVIQTILSR
jgi:6-methylsalicylate decarboxylase